jgi:hypothetical protein
MEFTIKIDPKYTVPLDPTLKPLSSKCCVCRKEWEDEEQIVYNKRNECAACLSCSGWLWFSCQAQQNYSSITKVWESLRMTTITKETQTVKAEDKQSEKTKRKVLVKE